MKNLNTLYKLIISLNIIVVLFSCSKEDEPVKLAEVETEEFDQGYLIIKLESDPTYLDSVRYTNNTQNTSFKIEKGQFQGYNPSTNPITSISRALTNGKKNDAVQCCFYVNAPINIGAVFEDLSLTVDSNYLDSVNTVNTGGNPVFCITGSY